jgi:hypothetical protein
MAPARSSGQNTGPSRRRAVTISASTMMRGSHTLLLITAALCAASLPFPAHAAEPASKTDLAHSVKLFNILCLSQLPDLDGVAKAAGLGEFAPVMDKNLGAYRTQEQMQDMRAWRFHDASGEFVLTAGKTRPDDAFKKSAPKFAKATATTCALHVPGSESSDTIRASLLALFGRTADKSWDEGATHISAWSKETGKHLSQVHFYAATKRGLNGVLRATIFVLN